MIMFQLMMMSSYAKNKLKLCSVTQHQCRRCQMCFFFPNLTSTLCYKRWLELMEQSLHGNISTHEVVLLCNEKTTNVFCHPTSQLTSPNVWEIFTNSSSTLTILKFQLFRMSSYAKNKLQMCLVTQHHCRRRQMCWKFSQIHPIHLLFICFKKWLVLTKLSILGKVSTHWDVLLC